MSLLFCDGFDSYAAAADLLKKWTTAPAPWAFNATAGPDGGGCAVATTSSQPLSSPAGVIPASSTRWCMGFWIKISGAITNQNFLIFATNTAVQQFFCRIMPGGAFGMWNNSASNFINGVRNICDNQWHWVEFDINTVTSATLKLSVDGVMEYNGAQGGNMGGVFIDRFAFYSISSLTVSVGPVVLWDNVGSGLTAASFPLGPREITTIRPDSDAAVQFARSSGSTNFSLVDEVNGDTTDWVESNVSGQQDLYGYAALGFTPANINAVMVNSYIHNPFAGMMNHQAVCKSGSTVSVGASKLAPPVTPYTNQQAFDLDPNGNIAWTQANLDAAQFGIKVV